MKELNIDIVKQWLSENNYNEPYLFNTDSVIEWAQNKDTFKSFGTTPDDWRAAINVVMKNDVSRFDEQADVFSKARIAVVDQFGNVMFFKEERTHLPPVYYILLKPNESVFAVNEDPMDITNGIRTQIAYGYDNKYEYHKRHINNSKIILDKEAIPLGVRKYAAHLAMKHGIHCHSFSDILSHEEKITELECEKNF